MEGQYELVTNQLGSCDQVQKGRWYKQGGKRR